MSLIISDTVSLVKYFFTITEKIFLEIKFSRELLVDGIHAGICLPLPPASYLSFGCGSAVFRHTAASYVTGRCRSAIFGESTTGDIAL